MLLNENSTLAERHKPNVILRNEPVLSEYEVDRGFNEMKKELVPHITQLVAGHDLFKDKGLILPHPNENFLKKSNNEGLLSSDEFDINNV